MYNNQGYPGGEQPQQPNYGPYSQGHPQGSYPPPQGSNPPPYSQYPPQPGYPPQQGYPYQPGAQPQQPYNPMVSPAPPFASRPPRRRGGGVSGCLSSIGSLLVLGLLILGFSNLGLIFDEKSGSMPLDPQASSYFKVVEMGKSKRVPLPNDPLYEPQTTFKRFDTVGIGFVLDFSKMDFEKQSAYYSDAKFFHKHWLLDIYTLADTENEKIMKIENDGLELGVHTISGLDDTGKWRAELYWCEQSDCSDAKLARSLDFVVE